MTSDDIDKAAQKAVELTNLCLLHNQYHGQQTLDCVVEERVIVTMTTPNTDWLDKILDAHYSFKIGRSKNEPYYHMTSDEAKQAILQHEQQAVIDAINETYKEILDIVFTYTHPDEPNFCDVDDVSRVAMSWKVDRIKELSK